MIIHTYWSSPPEVFCKIGVVRKFAKFKGKHLCQSLFFNKVARLWSATLLKKTFWHRCFLQEFCEIFVKLFSITSGGCFCTYMLVFASFLLKFSFCVFKQSKLWWFIILRLWFILTGNLNCMMTNMWSLKHKQQTLKFSHSYLF